MNLPKSVLRPQFAKNSISLLLNCCAKYKVWCKWHFHDMTTIAKWKNMRNIDSRDCRGVFRNLPDIYDGAFLRQWLTVFSCLLFLNKRSTIDDWQHPQYTSPPDIVSNSQHLTDIILSSMTSTPSIFHKSLASIFTASAEAMNKSKVKELLIKLIYNLIKLYSKPKWIVPDHWYKRQKNIWNMRRTLLHNATT